jgi:competence protein ComEC
MVLTHPQADHLPGLLGVRARHDVKRILAGPGTQPSAASAAWDAAVRVEGVDLETAHQGMSYDLGSDVTLEILGPDAAAAADPKINNTGVVARLVWRDVSFLLTADIEASAERSLLRDGIALQSTVLKVGHHGSKTSSTDAFLAAVHPAVSVVSSGKDNQFGHPAAEVVERLAPYGPVYNTADDGSIRSRRTVLIGRYPRAGSWQRPHAPR